MKASAGMDGGGATMNAPLSAAGVNFSNRTQAMNFLAAMLDDTELKVIGNAYARYFWYGTVVVIGLAAILNMIQTTILKSRFRAAAANKVQPARPTNLFTMSFATATALSREMAYPQTTPSSGAFWFRAPPMGTALLLATYLGFVMSLQFINNDVDGAQHYTALGIRASWLAIAQAPLLILLAGKNNLIGLLTGVSYVRLNVLHRWVARVFLLLATLHFGYQNYGWNQYGIMQLEWATDSCPPTGIAAYAILLWINLSTLAPIRNLSYEFFVIQHFITFVGFIVAIMYHLPTTALYSRVYIYIPIVLYVIDRIVRSVRYFYNNTSPGHATMTEYVGGVTKIRVRMNRIKSWTPGSYVLLSIPKFGVGQSHPATIASIPTSHDNHLVFLLKGHNGFTKRILKFATSTEEHTIEKPRYLTLVDGPYPPSHADFAAYDTVVLIAGSTGVTFTLPILLDIAHRATLRKLPVRRLKFLWVVKTASWMTWISEELRSAFHDIKEAGINISVTIFVTCDDNYTDSSWQAKLRGCDCDKSLAHCCCTAMSSGDDDVDPISPIKEKKRESGEFLKSPIRVFDKMIDQRSFATLKSGRPDLYTILWDLLDEAEGETGIAACGPLGLNITVRNTVAKISDQRAVHKGTGAQGIYLHVEGFSF